MQTMTMEHVRIPRSYTADSRAHMDKMNTPASDRGKKEIMLPPSSRARRLTSEMMHAMTS